MRTLLALALVGCGTGEWTPISDDGAPEMRAGAQTVWTGSEVMVWGGYINKEQTGCLVGENDLGTGALYDPASDTWSPISTDDAPGPTSSHQMWWTGTHALWWLEGSDTDPKVGHLYDPETDEWTAMADPEELLEPEIIYHPVWTGDELIVWAPGYASAAYDPATDSWRAIASFGERGDDRESYRTWSGTDVLIWSGPPYVSNEDGTDPADGPREDTIFYRYTPATDVWEDLGTEGGPTALLGPAGHAFWIDGEFIILEDAGRTRPWHYDPDAGSWRIGKMGPNGGMNVSNDTTIASWAHDTRGVFYEPADANWFRATARDRPVAMNSPAMVWTDDALFVWGGGAVNPCKEDRVAEGGGLWRP